jgi:hydroxymethylglutaryl-CoA lyase
MSQAAQGGGERVAVDCSFGCPMEGDVPQDTMCSATCGALPNWACAAVTLCDTTGMAYPAQVAA